MEVEDPSGRQMAVVKKAMITPVRDRWTVKVRGGPDLEVQGNILDHEYTIGEGRDKVAEVSKMVPGTRYLWCRDRGRAGRYPHSRGHCLHRPDVPLTS